MRDRSPGVPLRTDQRQITWCTTENGSETTTHSTRLHVAHRSTPGVSLRMDAEETVNTRCLASARLDERHSSDPASQQDDGGNPACCVEPGGT